MTRVLLVSQARFAASNLVPLDREARETFGGLLRWPWSGGDSGPSGQVTVSSGFPLSGFFLAVTAAGLFFLAALAVVGIWLPSTIRTDDTLKVCVSTTLGEEPEVEVAQG